MKRLILLGDSVIDNRAYVEPDEPDVPAQIRSLAPEWDIEMRAVDGFVARGVTDNLADRPPSDGAIFVSAGGNNALGHIGLLGDPDNVTYHKALSHLADVREQFRADFAGLMDKLAGRRVLVATIYNPNFQGEEGWLQQPAEGALSFFNDVIQQEALTKGFDILDLRRLFDDPADYANPIEPSARGGAKIARAVVDWARGNEPGEDHG